MCEGKENRFKKRLAFEEIEIIKGVSNKLNIVNKSIPVSKLANMCTSISKGPTLSMLQPTPKLHLQFSEQRCYVGCILIPCIDEVGPFEMDVHIYRYCTPRHDD